MHSANHSVGLQPQNPYLKPCSLAGHGVIELCPKRRRHQTLSYNTVIFNEVHLGPGPGRRSRRALQSGLWTRVHARSYRAACRFQISRIFTILSLARLAVCFALCGKHVFPSLTTAAGQPSHPLVRRDPRILVELLPQRRMPRLPTKMEGGVNGQWNPALAGR